MKLSHFFAFVSLLIHNAAVGTMAQNTMPDPQVININLGKNDAEVYSDGVGPTPPSRRDLQVWWWPWLWFSDCKCMMRLFWKKVIVIHFNRVIIIRFWFWGWRWHCWHPWYWGWWFPHWPWYIWWRPWYIWTWGNVIVLPFSRHLRQLQSSVNYPEPQLTPLYDGTDGLRVPEQKGQAVPTGAGASVGFFELKLGSDPFPSEDPTAEVDLEGEVRSGSPQDSGQICEIIDDPRIFGEPHIRVRRGVFLSGIFMRTSRKLTRESFLILYHADVGR